MITTEDAFFPVIISQWENVISSHDVEQNMADSRALLDRSKRELRKQLWIVQNARDLEVPR